MKVVYRIPNIAFSMLVFISLSGCFATQLRRAAKKGRTSQIQSLLDKGVDINEFHEQWSHGATALESAIAGGHLETVNLLLARGADVNGPKDFGRTPLDLAEMYGNIGIIRVLKNAGGINSNSKGGGLITEDASRETAGNTGENREMFTVARKVNHESAGAGMLSAAPAQKSSIKTVENPRRAETSADPTPNRVIQSDIDELPSIRVPTKTKAHAIVIGVSNYREKLPQADFADNDARLVSKYLTQVLGYQDENVVTIINDRAAKGDFEKYIESWLPNRVEKGDEVFIYYSGHGAPNPTTGDAYLVPYDGDPTYLEKTAYPIKKMYTQLAMLPTNKITVVMDSCFSGAGGRSVIAKGAKPLVTIVDGGALPSNIVVLSASAGDQISHSYDEKGHGLFTYFFLKGLAQEAGKRNVNMKEIFDYAGPQVSRIARREYNSDQVPQWKGIEH